MSESIHKSHNVTVVMYYLVFPAKSRQAVLDSRADEVLKEAGLEIEERTKEVFGNIGTDKNPVHFLSVLTAFLIMARIITSRKSRLIPAMAQGGSSGGNSGLDSMSCSLKLSSIPHPQVIQDNRSRSNFSLLLECSAISDIRNAMAMPNMGKS